MAKTSGSVRKRFLNDYKNVSAGARVDKKFEMSVPISAIKNPKLREEIQQGISKFESRLGIGTKNIRMGATGDAVGVHYTVNGQSYGILLNKQIFLKGTVESINKQKQKAYDTGFLTPTNKRVQHTIIHELSHSVWNRHLTTKNALKAKPEINKLWNEFQKTRPKGYGTYAYANISEMVAEMLTKHTIGTSDKYTKKLYSILRKNKLVNTKK